MADSGVQVLSGGEVLLSGAAVLWLSTALERVVHELRRNGSRSPVVEGWLAAFRDASARTGAAGVGSPAVPTGPVRAQSGPVDPLSAQEAAVILNRKCRNVTDLCKRGVFESAVRVAGRWQIERAEVLDRAERIAA